MKRVLLDVDGVLADFTRGALAILRSQLGLEFTREQITHFDIAASLGLTPAQAAAFKRALGNTDGFARKLEPCLDAIAGFAKLAAVADVYIVTSPWNSNPTWTHDREWWLREHFGIAHRRVIHTSAKHVCVGDVLVDDKTSTLIEWNRERGGEAIQWATPHNRLDGWSGRSTCSWDELVEWVRS